MRIAELSRQADVPVPTIKYYLREGLLPPGELRSANQAQYGEEHVRRLKLVRALIEVGRLPIAAIRRVLEHMDEPEPNLHNVLGHALMGLDQRGPADDEQLAAALKEIESLAERRGWRLSPDGPTKLAAAEVIAALRQLGVTEPLENIDDYADTAERVAQVDMKLVRKRLEDPAGLVYGVVIGTVVGDQLLAALRRLAQEDASARMFGITEVTEPC
ncbi:DNA-binding transcriptional MerR regulator [Allocatelliglobosispora scoriae]|uniref:DNA-binding transcriptional MerR regulator n=1 Tax=Allocatelliglobosispora scoriae TaxID=643052 RepID=A0A841BK77_9ACTN|nr:MerR family transcriptional regulator [Allocatelliglobosispora scoriae]MBB5868045.1 DNA-binding transcriptional MerR regulator [Allocatelliglobosispora scoriae]